MPELIAAVQAGDIDQVKRIIEEAESNNDTRIIDAGDNLDVTPLMWACIKGHRDIADYLLRHKADINKMAKGIGASERIIHGAGNNALMFACIYGDDLLVDLLLNYGANPTICNITGVTAFTIVARAGKLGMMKLLMNSSSVIDIHIKSYAFYLAAVRGHMDVMQYLYEHGAKINNVYSEDDSRGSALVAAVKCGAIDIVKLLLDMSADINVCNSDKSTILMLAAERSDYLIMELIFNKRLVHRAYLNLKNDMGHTALIFAVQSGSIKVVEFLLDKGVDINLGDRRGNSPLMFAVSKDLVDVAKLLIVRGALSDYLDKVIQRFKVSDEMIKLVLGTLHIDDVLMSQVYFGSKSCDKNIKEHCYPEFIEVFVDRIVCRLIQADISVNAIKLEEYFNQYKDNIDPKIFDKIQNDIILYKIADIFYADTKYSFVSMPILSEDMIEDICKLFEMRISRVVCGENDFALMRKVAYRNEWSVLSEKIIDLIDQYDVVMSENDSDESSEYVGIDILGSFGNDDNPV